MTTYTIVFDKKLYVCLPDGSDLATEMRIVEGTTGVRFDRRRVRIETGLGLTNDLPSDPHRVVWTSGPSGWLQDAGGERYKYAVTADG